jgi:hypothetical protein
MKAGKKKTIYKASKYVECLLKLFFLRKRTYNGVQWIKLFQDNIHLKAFVNTVRKLPVLWKNVFYEVIFLLLLKIRVFSNLWTQCWPKYPRLFIDLLITPFLSKQMFKDAKDYSQSKMYF